MEGPRVCEVCKKTLVAPFSAFIVVPNEHTEVSICQDCFSESFSASFITALGHSLTFGDLHKHKED